MSERSELERLSELSSSTTHARKKPTHTPLRSMRVADDVWLAAQAKAAERGESVSEAVVAFLRSYGETATGQ